MLRIWGAWSQLLAFEVDMDWIREGSHVIVKLGLLQQVQKVVGYDVNLLGKNHLLKTAEKTSVFRGYQ